MDKQAPTKRTLAVKFKASASDTSSSSPVLIATPSTISLVAIDDLASMESAQGSGTADDTGQPQQEHSTPTPDVGPIEAASDNGPSPSSKKDKGKSKRASSTKRKNARKKESSDNSESESSNSSDSSNDSSSDSESSEDERSRRKKGKKSLKKKNKEKSKLKKSTKAKGKRAKKCDTSSSDSSDSDSSPSDSESDSDDDKKKKKRRKNKSKHRKSKSKKDDTSSDSSSSEDEKTESTQNTQTTTTTTTASNIPELQAAYSKQTADAAQLQLQLLQATGGIAPPPLSLDTNNGGSSSKNNHEYKRVDEVYDPKLRDYKLTETTQEKKDEFDSVFAVRRVFGSDNKYLYTTVDLKANDLKAAVKVILKDLKNLSLDEETPSVDPNILYLFLDELKVFYKRTLKKQLKKERKKKRKKQLKQQIAHCKLLAGYIDKDYKKIRKTLVPMLKAGNITFDLIWALFKPGNIAYSPTYGNREDPRCFKLEFAYKDTNFMEQKWWQIGGRYLEYDGKIFGLADYERRIDSFKGSRKITSLATYPLSYHKDATTLRTNLIERGKKFVELAGMNYRSYEGITYIQERKSVRKESVEGRIMVDPKAFRRTLPNYMTQQIKRKEDEFSKSPTKSSGDSSCSDDSDDDSDASDDSDEAAGNKKWRLFKDKQGKNWVVNITKKRYEDAFDKDQFEPVDTDENGSHLFIEEEFLISSPVVLGFSFSRKLWVEFSVSNIKDISWNDGAFDSLVLEENKKVYLKALVSSHRTNGDKTVEDVIQGKGKGLNIVLHGPPGVGKTLTAEGIADFLQCPLYIVSAGELGTDSRTLETDLSRIMDITHAWGAILLLDEADVFLEQRRSQDVHRNALVSVFLRLLEYYQGILFLTTNRVEEFDEAFQSRIHLGLKYKELSPKARREIWKYYIDKVVAIATQSSVSFTEADYEHLSKKSLNGRQIKYAVQNSQILAMAEDKPFSLQYIKRHLEIVDDFELDLKGGAGYREAMNSYT